ncbi:TlpA family protein disulfide reductase [Posidoniimonas polymericola]|nr:redoxin family protein [Posidoniimonas polymericola]
MTAPMTTACLATLLAATFALPAAAEVPPVLLSTQHRAMCQVGIGDAMPELTLSADGGDQSLADLRGKTATVVAFVGQEHWMNPQLIADLPGDVLEPYGEKGVAVVLVKVAGSPAKVPQGSPLTVATDPSGEQFAKVGSGRLPRVYVLDAAGKIVWFDIEYSRSTRRELKQTLASVVGK